MDMRPNAESGHTATANQYHDYQKQGDTIGAFLANT
jgi:hypothetical protein